MVNGITCHQPNAKDLLPPLTKTKLKIQPNNKDEPSMLIQQRKATGPGLVGKRACTVAPHGCHPQSQRHLSQEKENHTCTLKRQTSSTDHSRLHFWFTHRFYEMKVCVKRILVLNQS